MSDAELINRVLQGNTGYYKELVEKYQQGVFRVCLGFVHQKEDADDITQEVFVSAFLALAAFKGKSAFSTWLYRIAINACLTFKRKLMRDILLIQESASKDDGSVLLFSPVESPAADELLIDKENMEQVHKAINSLPEKQRIAFVLSKYEDLPQKKVAEIMNTSEGAVEQLLQRAKCTLQKKLMTFYKRNYIKRRN